MSETGNGGLDAVKQELRKDSERKANALVEEGEAEAQRILSQAKKQAKEIVERAEGEATQQAGEQSSRVSAARLKAGMLVAQAREQAISKAMQQLLAALSTSSSGRSASKSGYERLFGKLAKEGLRQVEGGVIRCRKQDAALARKFGRVGEPINCSGGLVIESSDGRVRLDATFEGLLEEHKDELGKKAYELLFERKA